MPNFGFWATLYGFNGLESRKKNLNGLQIIIIIIFWLGHDLGCRLGPNLVGLNKARGACLGLGKKICLIIGLGPNHGSGYAKTRPIAIPISSFIGCLEDGPCFLSTFNRRYLLELLIHDCTE